MRAATTAATLEVMSEPQQPPASPSGHDISAAPPAPPAAQLPAAPQYPASPPHLAAPQHPAALPHTAAPRHSAAPQYPATPQAYPTATPGPQSPAQTAPGFPGQTAPGFPGQAASPPAARDGNPLGRTAFVIALATFVINLFGSLVRPFVYSGGGGFEFMLAFDNGIGILSFFAYVAALVLGLIAVRRPG